MTRNASRVHSKHTPAPRAVEHLDARCPNTSKIQFFCSCNGSDHAEFEALCEDEFCALSALMSFAAAPVVFATRENCIREMMRRASNEHREALERARRDSGPQ